MEKLIYNFFSIWWVQKLLIPFILFVLWIVLTIVYIISFDTSFLILPQNHIYAKLEGSDGKLLQGNKIKGSFTAEESNLGIVSIRFQTFDRVPFSQENHLVFRLKQYGQKDWYYQNAYRTGLIYDVPFFPFGFPQIKASKGKSYEFEIQSLSGNDQNAVSLQDREPVLVTKYKITKSAFLQNKIFALEFLSKKFARGFQNQEVIFSSFIYLLPLSFYLFLISPIGIKIGKLTSNYIGFITSKLGKIKIFGHTTHVVKIIRTIVASYFNALIIILIIIDIFYLQLLNDMPYFVLLVLWLLVGIGHKRQIYRSFAIGIILIILAGLSSLQVQSHISEKAAIWAYIFILASWVEAFLDLHKSTARFAKN